MSETTAKAETPAFPRADSIEQLRRNIEAVNQRIANACRRVGRDAAEVRLLPVSKTVDQARVRAAHAAGCRWLGENLAQELRAKAEALSQLDIRWAMIGHLQTNKVKYIARLASEFHALDSLKIAGALDRRLQIEGRGLDVFVQVNSSREASKYGLDPAEVPAFARELRSFSSLRVRGLMTLAVHSSDETSVRACFRTMRRLQERLRQEAPDGLSFDEPSMGMSSDFEIAIEEGATHVRVGQAIFGARATPDELYWPGSPRPS